MADEEIKIQITADDQASAKLRAMGDTAKKSSETARMGMYALGEAAETAGEKMGIPREVSRHLGSSVERMAASLGTAGIALGAVGLAATSAAMIWKNYREEQEKVREEKIKQGMEAGAWIENIAKEKENTDELIKAKQRLLQAQLALNKANTEAAIPELRKKIEGLVEEYNKLREVVGGKTPLFMKTENGENVFEAADRQSQSLLLTIRKLVAELGVLQSQSSLATKSLSDKLGGATSPAWSEFEFAQMQGSMMAEEKRNQAEVLLQIERDKYNAMQELRYINNQNEIAAMQANLQFQQMYTDQSMKVMNNALSAYAASTDKNAKYVFLAQKALAMAQIWVDTSRAAMSAAAATAVLGPAAAAAAAASMWKLGYLNMAIVAATTMANLSSAGRSPGGASGVFSVNPITNQPDGGGSQSSVNLTINVNGRNAGVMELTGDVLRTIYNSNGSVDGFSVNVERSA